MGSETGDRERDARSRVCARKRSVAAGADRAAYARWSRYGKSLPAARAKPLWTRVAGRDGARFRRGGIGEMAEERNNEEASRKNRTRLHKVMAWQASNADESRAGAELR